MKTFSVVEIFEFTKVAEEWTMNEPAVDVLCKHCGQTFSAFLKEMAEKNFKAMCPCCGEHTEYSATDASLGLRRRTKVIREHGQLD